MLVLTPLGRRWITLLCLSLAPIAADAVTSPGQVDLTALGFAPGAEATTNLTIGSSDFAVAALIAQATDPDLSALLANVKAFSLRQYAPPDAATIAATQALTTGLLADGWQLVEAELQDTRQVSVYAMVDGAIVAGLVVIAVDAEHEVSVANVVGDIQPSQLATLGLPIPQ